MIPPKVYELCHRDKTLTAELAKNPHEHPSSVCKRLFDIDTEDDVEDKKHESATKGASDIDQARECGNWGGSEPSDLFLKIYHDVLGTLETNPLINLCTPSLIGSHGVCPLVIISGIPDIARHMANLIARAEHEVFIATNFWMISEPSKLITLALVELSKRAGKENRRPVVKVMYDRGSAKQFINNHQWITPEEYADPDGKIQLPHPNEIPHVDLEVVNYHRPLLGTFHSKFMVVDRKIGIVQSDNIQDNDNMEMMVQLEGPIVDSLYETALISWHNELKPPFPCLNTPAASNPPPSFQVASHAEIHDKEGNLTSKYQYNSSPATSDDLPQHTSLSPQYDPDIASALLRNNASLRPLPSETPISAISRHLNTTPTNKTTPTTTTLLTPFTPFIPLPPHSPIPIALVSRPPFALPTFHSLHTPQNVAWLSAFRYATKSIYIQSPDVNAQALPAAILSACRRGIKVTYVYCLGYNDAGEMLPLQGGHNEGFAHALYKDLELQYHGNLEVFVYIAKDQERPVHNSFKARSCHIKLMVIDGHIGIMGSGNQDSQSWYHSQEVNIMIDDPMIVGKWMQGIRGCQNSFEFGRCQDGRVVDGTESEGKGEKEGDRMKMAGCWVDAHGKMVEGALGVDAGRFTWFRGAMGALQRVRGVGGF